MSSLATASSEGQGGPTKDTLVSKVEEVSTSGSSSPTLPPPLTVSPPLSQSGAENGIQDLSYPLSYTSQPCTTERERNSPGVEQAPIFQRRNRSRGGVQGHNFSNAPQ